MSEKTLKKRVGSSWCSAPNCSNNSKKNPDKSFFRFPKCLERSKSWLQACHRQDLFSKTPEYLTKNIRICSDHFEAKAFSNFQRNRLFEHAVPTIFNLSITRPFIPSKRKLQSSKDNDLKKMKSDLSSSPMSTSSPSWSNFPKCIITKFNIDLSSPYKPVLPK